MSFIPPTNESSPTIHWGDNYNHSREWKIERGAIPPSSSTSEPFKPSLEGRTIPVENYNPEAEWNHSGKNSYFRNSTFEFTYEAASFKFGQSDLTNFNATPLNIKNIYEQYYFDDETEEQVVQEEADEKKGDDPVQPETYDYIFQIDEEILPLANEGENQMETSSGISRQINKTDSPKQAIISAFMKRESAMQDLGTIFNFEWDSQSPKLL